MRATDGRSEEGCEEDGQRRAQLNREPPGEVDVCNLFADCLDNAVAQDGEAKGNAEAGEGENPQWGADAAHFLALSAVPEVEFLHDGVGAGRVRCVIGPVGEALQACSKYLQVLEELLGLLSLRPRRP